jgi:3-dehydroquinate dehydratase / shikimate dehydrogenase
MAHPLLCVTVAAGTIDELRRQRDEAAGVADLVELRLDALRAPQVAGAIAGRRGPVLVTCRPRWEGGAFEGAEEERLRLLTEAFRLGAEYVDVEWRAEHTGLVSQRGGRGIVLSTHDFESMPGDLEARYRAMRATGAEVVKLAGRARALGDCLPLLAIGREAARSGDRVALVAMGPEGVATRLLPARFGSCWSYAGDGVAPGQLTARRMIGEYRYRDVHAATRVFGLVGRPVRHSLSPAMHNAAFHACGIDAVYVPFEARDAADFVAFAAAVGVEGASVTAPFKVALLEAAGSLDEASRASGALNTLRRRDGAWLGRNTDVAGFLAPLAGVPLAGTHAAVLGTGGAARAVVAAVRSRGASVVVYGRDLQKAAAVAGEDAVAGARVEARVGAPARGSWDLLVNATTVGTFPDLDASPIAADLLAGGVVYDLVYNPARTKLLRDAEAAGCRTIGGLEMLLAQAELQFEWWTGVEAPAGVMRDAARARLTMMTGVR